MIWDMVADLDRTPFSIKNKAKSLHLCRNEDVRLAVIKAGQIRGGLASVHTRIVDRWRWRTGQEQHTNIHFVNMTRSKKMAIYRLRKMGYIYFPKEPDTLYYDDNTQRNYAKEKKARKHFKNIIPLANEENIH